MVSVQTTRTTVLIKLKIDLRLKRLFSASWILKWDLRLTVSLATQNTQPNLRLKLFRKSNFSTGLVKLSTHLQWDNHPPPGTGY